MPSGDNDVYRQLTPEQVGLKECNPDGTYLDGDGYERCWVGGRWDIAERDGKFHLYRKGNWRIAVGSLGLACAVVADDA